MPSEEDVHLALMETYAREKRNIQVYKQYQTLEKVLAKELNICPSDKAISWYKNWVTIV